MTFIRATRWSIVCAVASAMAQLPDCPRADAQMPSGPPGPPPRWLPPSNVPERFGDPVPPMQSRELTAQDVAPGESKRAQDDFAQRRANNWLTDAEEGHVSALLFMEKRSRTAPLPADLAGAAIDISSTPLAAWRYVGYFDEHSRNRALRIFRAADGSVLSLSEWDYKADGGAIISLAGMDNRKVGAYPASLHGLRAPSGCVKSSLSWQDGRKDYRLEIAGPLDVEGQRAVLMQIGEAIAAR